MHVQNGNIGTEFAKNGASVLVEKGYMPLGTINKALSQDQVKLELAGVEIPTGTTVWKVVMANTMRDRHNEVIPMPVLAKFSEQINKKGLSLNYMHNRAYVIGKVLPKAAVLPSGSGFELVGYIAIYDNAAPPTNSTDGKGISINKMILDGSMEDVSTEFMGRSNYVSPETSSAKGHWEYIIDPERPEDTEITGLAVVPKGAQRDASVVKSIDGNNKETPKTENMNVFTDKAVGAGEKFPLELVDGKLKGLDAIEKKLDDLHKEKSEAMTAKEKAVADLAAEKAAIEPVRKSLIADCENFGKAIGETHKAEDLEKLSLKELFDKREGILKKHDEQNAPKKATEAKKANDDGQPKAFFTITAKPA